MAEITYFDADELKERLTCSVDLQGKLYFSASACKFIGLDKYVCVHLGRKEDNNVLFLRFHDTKERGTFNIQKSGNKKYINIKPLFKSLSSVYLNLKDKPKYKLTKAKGEPENVFQLTLILKKEKK